jgi:addiction module HigA family antidote
VKIRNFTHKGLERLYTDANPKGVSADSVDKLRKMFAFLDAMQNPEELRTLTAWKAHTMTGDRKGTVSLSVTRNRRLTFRVNAAEPEIYDVNLKITTDRKGAAMITTMKNPPHPGDFIRTEIIEPAGLTVTAAAAALQVSRPALSSLLNGKADLSGEMALRIEKAFGVKMDTLMRMQSAYDIARARKDEKKIHVRRVRVNHAHP